jgi:hypothetical protein
MDDATLVAAEAACVWLSIADMEPIIVPLRFDAAIMHRAGALVRTIGEEPTFDCERPPAAADDGQEKTTSCMKHEVAKVQGGGAPKRAYPNGP